MDRLAIDIGKDAENEDGQGMHVTLPMALRNVAAVTTCADVLCFKRFLKGAFFCATAEVRTVEDQGNLAVLVLSKRQWFERPVPYEDPPAADWAIINEEEFDSIVAKSLDSLGLGEMAQLFLGEDADDQRSEDALYRRVLLRSGGLCELSGHSMAAEALRAATEVEFITPRHYGGRADMGNALALSEAAARAFRLFHLTIGPDFEIIADHSVVDPELIERLNPNGRLKVPERLEADVARSLAWHRQKFFEQRQ